MGLEKKMNFKEDKGLILIIIGILCSITVFGLLIGIPLIIIGTYFLYKKPNIVEKDLDDKLKEKRDELNNINVKLDELEKKKEQEIDNKLKNKHQELDNIDAKLDKMEKRKEKEIDDKLKGKENELDNINSQLAKRKKDLQVVDDELNIKESGLYKPKYDFLTSLEFKDKLDDVRKEQKQSIKDKTATKVFNNVTVDGDKRKGQALTNANIKQLLRNFNLECEITTNKVTTSNIESSTNKIEKSFSTLNRMNERNGIKITGYYLRLKLDELNIAYEYELKKQEEKEILREEREKEKEEKRIQKQLDKEKNKFDKENERIDSNINDINKKMEETSSDEEKQKLEEEIKQLKEALAKNNQEIENINEKKEQTGAGYVYIISNIGSFGEDVYKIGVTRRDDPQDRINELSNASVPFKYDAHAFIFSKDAYGLEKAIHDKFDHKRVNKVNKRKEFFNINMDEVKKIVEKHKSEVHSFNEEAEAQEYKDSLKILKQKT